MFYNLRIYFFQRFRVAQINNRRTRSQSRGRQGNNNKIISRQNRFGTAARRGRQPANNNINRNNRSNVGRGRGRSQSRGRTGRPAQTGGNFINIYM